MSSRVIGRKLFLLVAAQSCVFVTGTKFNHKFQTKVGCEVLAMRVQMSEGIAEDLSPSARKLPPRSWGLKPTVTASERELRFLVGLLWTWPDMRVRALRSCMSHFPSPKCNSPNWSYRCFKVLKPFKPCSLFGRSFLYKDIAMPGTQATGIEMPSVWLHRPTYSFLFLFLFFIASYHRSDRR